MTATTNGIGIDYGRSPKGIRLSLSIASIGGTSPSYQPKLQYSADGGTTWIDLGTSWTARTANGDYSEVQIDPVATRIRLVITVSGTTPTASVTAILEVIY